MQYLERFGHQIDLKDPTSLLVPADECHVELAAVCRQCKQETKTHLSENEYHDLRKKFRDDWALGFWLYLGWEVSSGLCEQCYGRIKAVQRMLN